VLKGDFSHFTHKPVKHYSAIIEARHRLPRALLSREQDD
jgi:hypothetical protein